jgi:ketosteroid isomerase-like protein
MPQAHVEIARALWPGSEVDLVEVFRRGEVPPWGLSGLGPDTEVSFRTARPVLESPTYRGLAGLVEGWLDWLEPYESYRIVVEDYIEAGGDQVLIPARVRAKTRRDGVLIEHAPAAVCAISDGKVTQITFYLEREEAFKAVGLPTPSTHTSAPPPGDRPVPGRG